MLNLYIKSIDIRVLVWYKDHWRTTINTSINGALMYEGHCMKFELL